MSRRPLSLFLRLLLLTLPVEILILALFGGWLVRGSERRDRAAFDERLRLQGQAVFGGIGLGPSGKLSFDAAFNRRALGPETRGCLLGDEGATLWEWPAGWFHASGLKAFAQENVESVHDILVGGVSLRVLHASRKARRPGDTATATGPLVEVILARPLAALDRSNREFREKAAAVGLVLLALTVLLLWSAIKVGLRPVEAMMRKLHEAPGLAGADRLDESLAPAELRPLAREINGLSDRLWGLVQREKRFTAEAAHELRTPLTLVKSTLQTALLTCQSRDGYARALQEALEDLQRLEATAESLLALSRTDALSGGRIPAFEEVSLPDLLGTLAERFAASAAQRNVRILLDLHPCVTRGDHEMLERLFINLLDNAVKYAKHGGTVTLRCEKEEGAVLTAVEDSGPAIPGAERPRLFERFFRGATGRAAQVQGAGLGLSIAAAMARLHRAKITYEPCGADGNRFVVKFTGHEQPPDG